MEFVKRMRMLVVPTMAVFVAVVCVTEAAAQQRRGLGGQVVDDQGAVISGAKICVTGG